MKKISILFLGMSISLLSVAQSQDTQLIGASGTASQNGNVTLSWSVGEVVTATFQQNSLTLTQGYQQGELTVVSITEPEETSYTINAYPNPVAHSLMIEMSEPGKNYKLYHFSGRIMASGTFEQMKTTMDFSNFGPGTYFLQIEDTKTHKIIKK